MVGYSLIEVFVNNNFPDIEGVLLFGSYIDNPAKANDIDLLLLSEKFLYSSKELFVFEGIKFNIIKFNVSEVFSILAKHYLQGDFYRLVFENGIIIVDRKKDLQFIKHYIIGHYPENNKDNLAFGLNETSFRLTECNDSLKRKLSQIEYFAVTSKIIFHLIDWFLLSNSIHNVQLDNKYKSTFFSKHFPVENKSLLKLIAVCQKNNQKEFLLEFQYIAQQFLIPYKDQYSNDLIFDNYIHSNLILFIENLFVFNDLKQIIKNIRSQKKEIHFYVYQVDENNQEKAGCYIVFDNSRLEIHGEKQKWIDFFRKQFSKYYYSFPYNNIYCYPEIKFLGKTNETIVTQYLTFQTKLFLEKDFSKEAFFMNFLDYYLSLTEIKIDDIYNFYLGKLTAKSRSSNYFIKKNEETQFRFIGANSENEKKLLSIFTEIGKLDLNLDFKIVKNVPIWFHFQVIDRVISPLLKNDFEKLFYIHCLIKLNE